MLGPVLFFIYIDNLPECVSCRIRMYADYTNCFSKIDCLADVDVFQQNIDKLMSWSLTYSSVSVHQSVIVFTCTFFCLYLTYIHCLTFSNVN